MGGLGGGLHGKLNNAREQCTALQTWVGGGGGGGGFPLKEPASVAAVMEANDCIQGPYGKVTASKQSN